MTHSQPTVQEFIKNTFSPMVGVLCSPFVEQTCQKNNLSFIELLQPFCKFSDEAQIRDASGAAVAIHNLRIKFMDAATSPPQPINARRLLNSAVTVDTDPFTSTFQKYDYNLNIPLTTPWFDAWRETFLQLQLPSDHEFTKHFLACVIVVSSNEVNPLESLNNLLYSLTRLQNPAQTKLPKWFSNNILIYYVLLHDMLEGNRDTAFKTMESLKQSYGNNCFLLNINSRQAGTLDDQSVPDVWSKYVRRKMESTESSITESPCSPAEPGSVNSMPSSITSDTLFTPHSSSTPTVNSPVDKVEIVPNLEVVSPLVSYHPLCPDVVEDRRLSSFTLNESIVVPVNINVWQGAPTALSVVYGTCLSAENVEQIKLLIHDFCIKSLFPYIEKQIQQIHEQVSNKKGVSRSLFSATKRWFTSNKPGTTGANVGFTSVIYTNECSELQLRRLGDLYFLFGLYTMAYQTYYSAKREFSMDQAWLYYAGALEMAALSAFMCGEANRKTCDYMEDAIITYLSTCRMPQFAARATLLSCEYLKKMNQHGEVAHQFIRMTSEDSDLRSALFLEQAAYAFLSHKQSMVRKYAFHMVLAGHRYSKSSQRTHSLRCYRQAYEVYNRKGWSLAEDHIDYTIGKQASYLKKLNEAAEAFAKLLVPKSRQNAQQQAIFLREYLNVYCLLIKGQQDSSNKILPVLPLPKFDSNLIKVLLGPQNPLNVPGQISATDVNFKSEVDDELFKKWNKLEAMIVQELQGTQMMVFKPVISLYTNKNSIENKPIAVMGEPIILSVTLYNTFQITLVLKNVFLLWKYTDNNVTVRNELVDNMNTDKYVRTHVVDFINVVPGSDKELMLSITPLAVGEVTIEGMCYTVCDISSGDKPNVYITGKQNFEIRGPRLKVKEKNEIVYAHDKRLEITIAPSAPFLQVIFSEIRHNVFANEIQKVSIELKNCGSFPLHKIMIASSLPHLFSICCSDKKIKTYKIDPFLQEKQFRKIHINPVKLPSNFNNILEPGQSHIIHMWLRAPANKGSAAVDLLFYYENVNKECIPKYRLVRHVWNLNVQNCLILTVDAFNSNLSDNVEALCLSLKATNNVAIQKESTSEIRLIQTGLISDSWKLSSDVNIPKVILQTDESITIILKAYRSIKSKKGTQYSNLVFCKRNQLDTDLQTPCMDFARKSFVEEFNIFNNSFTNKDIISKNLEGMMIFNWQALVMDTDGKIKSVIGQQHLPIKKLPILETESNLNNIVSFDTNNIEENVSKNPDDMSLALLQKQVNYNMIHTSKIEHDFTLKKLCIVPVRMILHNSVDEILIIKVNTLGTSSATTENLQKTDLCNLRSSSKFHWVGHTQFICSLQPFSSHQLMLNAAFSAPGTYDLGGQVELLCKQTDQVYNTVMQCCKIHSSVIISQRQYTELYSKVS